VAGWKSVVGADRDALRHGLADAGFMDRLRPRPRLFGDGRAAEGIVAAVDAHQARMGAEGGEPLAPNAVEAGSS
jgi:hypothetical protein